MEQIEADIREAYASGRFGAAGWRHLYSPVETMDARFAIIGTNPGGGTADSPPPGEPTEWFATRRHAIMHEPWKGHPPGKECLQRQYKRLCERFDEPVEDTLVFNLVPFRSVRLSALPNGAEALEIGARIARATLDAAPNMERVALNGLRVAEVLGIELRTYDTGWRNGRGGQYQMGRGCWRGMEVYAFPHLSRFTLFGRPASQPYIDVMLTS